MLQNPGASELAGSCRHALQVGMCMRAVRLTTAIAPAVALALALAGCASKPPASDPDAVADYEQTNDPLEPTNRVFYEVDDAIDRYTLKPIAQGYVYITPEPVRNGIHNVLANLSSPVLFANDVAQARPRHAGDTFMRFLINSTVGVVGVFDVAKSLGYRAHDTDFGVTLGVWGVGEGPFLYLPILGPDSPRSVVGYGADTALDPFTWVPKGYGLRTLNWARYGMGAIDTRARLLGDLDKIKATALDPYASIRSLYRQHVQSQVDAARAPEQLTPPSWQSQ
ncbi:MAG: VacJ family lipoprotein [Rhodospirillales bacterium]